MTATERKYVFEWKIKNVSMWDMKYNEEIKSPAFKAENLGGSKWILTLCSIGYTRNFKTFTSIYLESVDGDIDINTTARLELLDCDANILTSRLCDKIDNRDMTISDFFLTEKIKNLADDILTIRCYIFGDAVLLNNSAVGSIAWTNVGVDRCSFKWNLDIPVSALWRRERHIFISENSQFKIYLSSLIDDIEISMIYEYMDEDKSKSKVVSCKISILCLTGALTEYKSAKHSFGVDDRVRWKFPTFFSKSYLQSKSHDLILNNSFTLNFEIAASTGEFWKEIKEVHFADPISETSVSDTPCLDDSISALQEDLRNMLKTDENHDVKLRVKDGIIPANRFFLKARSPVFRAMFNQDMLENQTGVVEIQDIDTETMNFLLEFVYTGNVSDLNYERAKKLIVAADKYQIPSLTKKCSSFLVSQLAIENVCDLVALADRISLTNLKVSTMKFIEKNSKKVILSNLWPEWMAKNVVLANEILYNFARTSLQ